jgi:hypothetical protein
LAGEGSGAVGLFGHPKRGVGAALLTAHDPDRMHSGPPLMIGSGIVLAVAYDRFTLVEDTKHVGYEENQ